MKKILIFMLILLLSTSLIGKGFFQHETQNDKIVINYENEEKNLDGVEKTITKIFALPFSAAEISLNNCSVSVFSEHKKFLRKENLRNEDRIRISDSFTMRELHAFQVTIDIMVSGDKNISKISNLDFEIIGHGSISIPEKISPAFIPAYKSCLDNFADSYLGRTEISEPNMLIIGHSTLASTLEIFMEWKEAKGIECTLANLEDIGNTNNEIKDYIQEVYDTSENPPAYLLLIGDVTGYYSLPSFYFSDENDVTDHAYTLLEGGDYFPEMLVGRFSFDSIFELQTLISKVIDYEKNPYVAEPEWLQKALLVAGNYSTTPPTPTTPVKMSRWLQEKMLDYGYTQLTQYSIPPLTRVQMKLLILLILG